MSFGTKNEKPEGKAVAAKSGDEDYDFDSPATDEQKQRILRISCLVLAIIIIIGIIIFGMNSCEESDEPVDQEETTGLAPHPPQPTLPEDEPEISPTEIPSESETPSETTTTETSTSEPKPPEENPHGEGELPDPSDPETMPMKMVAKYFTDSVLGGPVTEKHDHEKQFEKVKKDYGTDDLEFSAWWIGNDEHSIGWEAASDKGMEWVVSAKPSGTRQASNYEDGYVVSQKVTNFTKVGNDKVATLTPFKVEVLLVPEDNQWKVKNYTFPDTNAVPSWH